MMRPIRGYWNRILALVLVMGLLTFWPALSAHAAEGDGTGKYVRDVFVAYGKTKEEAAAWLEDNSWEPIRADQSSDAVEDDLLGDGRMAAVLGIRRTDDQTDAITDMAVMNMADSAGAAGQGTSPIGGGLVLYTEKDAGKHAPILADSLTLQRGGGEIPDGCHKVLYFFDRSSAGDPGAASSAYVNETEKVVLFWSTEENDLAPSSASAFTGGQLALIGAAGLAVGILGATMVLLPKRKRVWIDEGGNL